MANAIKNYNGQLGGQPGQTAIGLAQWHARDMNSHDYVGLVGSDGVGFLQRWACSGGAPQDGGVIAVGQSSDVNAVLNFLKSDPSANKVLTLGGSANTRVAVGYANGFWLIIVY